jgi:hypothetical protein
MKDIPIAELPQTIQDAIEVTYKLGLSHLWVDSLCILQPDSSTGEEDQDCIEDLREEIPRMTDIYRGAYVTISAACARDCKEGFLKQPRFASIPTIFPDGAVGALNLYQVSATVAEPIHSRAWTLQEHFQSSRILEYGTYKLRRLCRSDPENTTRLASSDPLYEAFHPNTSLSYHLRAFMSVESLHEQPETVLRSWRHLVRDYSSRDITKPSDRTLAIQSITKTYEHLLKEENVAGLWHPTRVPRELVWQRVSRATPRAQQDYAPSWSWFSLDNTTVDWDDKVSHLALGQCKIQLLPGHAKHPTQHLTGGVQALELKGHAREGRWHPGSFSLYSKHDGSNQTVAAVTHDAMEAFAGGLGLYDTIRVTTMEILTSKDGSPPSSVGLVLMEDKTRGVFTRIGVYRSFSSARDDVASQWLEEFKMMSVHVV